MELSFVNVHGQVVDVTPVKAKRATKAKEAHHDGWLATGISPGAIERAKELATRTDKEFNLQFFLRTAKREKIRTKPYFSAAAAREACELAQKAGWHACYTTEKKVD